MLLVKLLHRLGKVLPGIIGRKRAGMPFGGNTFQRPCPFFGNPAGDALLRQPAGESAPVGMKTADNLSLQGIFRTFKSSAENHPERMIMCRYGVGIVFLHKLGIITQAFAQKDAEGLKVIKVFFDGGNIASSGIQRKRAVDGIAQPPVKTAYGRQRMPEWRHGVGKSGWSAVFIKPDR